jgi:EmrB/QacA subfamily drug resistance transporter
MTSQITLAKEAGPEPRRAGLRGHPWLTLVAVAIGVMVVTLDGTIVAVANPAIQKDLGASLAEVQWITNGYLLALAVSLITAGKLGDRFGHRQTFLIGIAGFALSSAAIGLSTGVGLVIGFRVAQGVFGALLMPAALGLLRATFPAEKLNMAIGIWGMVIGASTAAGPIVGGLLVEHVSWQSIFFVNLPIGLAAIAVSLRTVRETRDPDAARVDLAGLVTFSAALFALVFALVRGNTEGWGSTTIVGLLVLSAVLLVSFVVVEARQERPMLDLTLFRNRTFVGVSIVAFALSASMFAMFLYLTLYLQNILGYSPLAAGLRFLPVTLLSFVCAAISGNLTERVPTRILLGVGLGLVALGLLLMSGVDKDSSWTHLLPGFLLGGAGVGLTNPAIASTAVGVVSPRRTGMAAGINNTFRQVGIATGIAGLGAIFQSIITSNVAEHAPPGTRLPSAEFLAQGRVKAVPPPLRDAFVSGWTTSFNTLLVIAALVALIGAISALALVRRKDFVAHGAPAGHGAG